MWSDTPLRIIPTFAAVSSEKVAYGIIRDGLWVGSATSASFRISRSAEQAAQLLLEAADITETQGEWCTFAERFTKDAPWVTYDDLEAAVHWHTGRKWQPRNDPPFALRDLRAIAPGLSQQPSGIQIFDAFGPPFDAEPAFLSCVGGKAVLLCRSPFDHDEFSGLIVVADMDCDQMLVVHKELYQRPRAWRVVVCAALVDAAALRRSAESLRMYGERSDAFFANWSQPRGEAPAWTDIEMIDAPRRTFFAGISEMKSVGRPEGFPHIRKVNKALCASQAEEHEARRQALAPCAEKSCSNLTPNRWCSPECCDRNNTLKKQDHRYDCKGCGELLIRRQERWCSRRCAIIYFTPNYLGAELWDLQFGRCGICLLAIPRVLDAEVDHVEPLAGGGSRSLDNLLITHKACNQSKKAKSLADARRDLGITPHDIAVRLLAVPVNLWQMFRPSDLSLPDQPSMFD